ncbi:hypothetical protein MNBD_GAMMA12-3911 [hydrothermal vent metagenome]|uniref:Uncharacterized protein n=1 Tax=hydrothermal vent metagenome TaxID=652676 RepID=A0A3B0Y2Y4_9ZZZZ
MRLIIYKLLFIPLSMGLMTYPSIIWQVALDEDKTIYFGFPVPWNSPSLVTSLEKNIYWLPLIFDMFFYAIVGYLLWKYISAYIEHWSAAIKLLVVAFISLYGLMASLLLMVLVSLGTSHSLWFDYDFSILNVSLGFSI